jgi:hypothetical protein
MSSISARVRFKFGILGWGSVKKALRLSVGNFIRATAAKLGTSATACFCSGATRWQAAHHRLAMISPFSTSAAAAQRGRNKSRRESIAAERELVVKTILNLPRSAFLTKMQSGKPPCCQALMLQTRKEKEGENTHDPSAKPADRQRPRQCSYSNLLSHSKLWSWESQGKYFVSLSLLHCRTASEPFFASASQGIQQRNGLRHLITAVFPWDEAPRYLIRDRDRIFGAIVARRLCTINFRDKPIAPASPLAERLCRAVNRIDPP